MKILKFNELRTNHELLLPFFTDFSKEVEDGVYNFIKKGYYRNDLELSLVLFFIQTTDNTNVILRIRAMEDFAFRYILHQSIRVDQVIFFDKLISDEFEKVVAFPPGKIVMFVKYFIKHNEKYVIYIVLDRKGRLFSREKKLDNFNQLIEKYKKIEALYE